MRSQLFLPCPERHGARPIRHSRHIFVADFALQQKNKRQLCDTMKAIILSAGQGRRLLPLPRRRPKCLINLSGISFLEWQLFALREAGVEEEVGRAAWRERGGQYV